MKNENLTPFKWKKLSKKQKKVLAWHLSEKLKNKDGIIADGSVRAGKTLSMSFSFVLWSMAIFNGEQLGLSGKTVTSFRRNVLTDLKRCLRGEGFRVSERRAENLLLVTDGNISNRFYIFGGKDEGSQDLIQGITLAGMFFDEVALMPESFVNQAVARCSIEGSKLWFNCNPEGPYHWFKVNWMDKIKEKNLYHLHFLMDDNLSLSDKIKDRYKRTFSGVFFKRFILGLWVLAEGVIYDMFNEKIHCIDKLPDKFDKRYIGIDYGTHNPTAFLDVGILKDEVYIIDEFYYCSKEQGRQKTDAEYSKDLKEFIKGKKIDTIFIDPSAASFKTQLRRDGITNIRDANNSVIDGIRTVGSFFSNEKLFIYKKNCKNIIKELSSYVWDIRAGEKGEDKPVKDKDHVLDALRYIIHTLYRRLTIGPVNVRI